MFCRFIISYFLSDDTIIVFEPPQRNSGILGGKFLERGRIKKPDDISYHIAQVSIFAYALWQWLQSRKVYCATFCVSLKIMQAAMVERTAESADCNKLSEDAVRMTYLYFGHAWIFFSISLLTNQGSPYCWEALLLIYSVVCLYMDAICKVGLWKKNVCFHWNSCVL